MRHAAAVTTVLVALTALGAWQPSERLLAKPVPAALRILTWNIYRDSIFPEEGHLVNAAAAGRPAQFARVLKALQPDVLCLQQVTVAVERSAALVDEILPLPGERKWQGHAAVDTVIVSRFDLGARGEGIVEDSSRRRGHAIAVIKTPASDLYMICAHFVSSDGPDDMSLRRQQAELVIRSIREGKAGRGVALEAGTPFVILGDFNSIPGDAMFINALTSRTGARRRDDRPGRGPDWDGSPLRDAAPHHNVSGSELYTWRNDLDRFPPSTLDRILYSDSVLESVNQFVLDTTAMSYSELIALGLRSIDVMRDPEVGIHDHLPLVIDLVARPLRRSR
jgi:endonuclease/exonuclease/phosphatase family metal-dependent hydrolase